jgi:hypothetical protein
LLNHALCGLAADEALPVELVDRLISVADADIADSLASRADLSREQTVSRATRVEESAVRHAYAGLLTAADVAPTGVRGLQPRPCLSRSCLSRHPTGI